MTAAHLLEAFTQPSMTWNNYVWLLDVISSSILLLLLLFFHAGFLDLIFILLRVHAGYLHFISALCR